MFLRVANQAPDRPIWTFAITAGFLAGMLSQLMYWLVTILIRLPLPVLALTAVVFDTAVCSISTFLLLRSYAGFFRPIGAAVAVWFAFGMGDAVVRYAIPSIAMPVVGAPEVLGVAVGLLTGSAIWALLGLIVSLLVQIVLHAAVFEYITQTGALCMRCGYDRADLPQCPECGTIPKSSSPLHLSFEKLCCWLDRRRWLLLSLAVLCITAGLGASLSVSQGRAKGLVGGSGTVARRVAGVVMAGAAKGGLGVAIYTSLDKASFGTLVVVPIDSVASGIAGQIQLAALDPNGKLLSTRPTVICNLSKEQMELVRSHGVPEPLRRELRERSTTCAVLDTDIMPWQVGDVVAQISRNPIGSIELKAEEFFRIPSGEFLPPKK